MTRQQVPNSAESFIEVDFCQRPKNGQLICGDVFLLEKVQHEDRIVSVLSDGLGSGVKASVLATITATMALKFTASTMDTLKSAEIIMDTLPICSVRKISYSTFTIVDMMSTGETRVIEHDNPPSLLIRPGSTATLAKLEMRPKRWQNRVIRVSTFHVEREDRIVFFSDGVTQAGMGEFQTPRGWGLEQADKFAREQICSNPFVSARELSRLIVAKAEEMDCRTAKDDITCGVVYFRSPRQLLVITGPPFDRTRDQDLATMVSLAPGRKVICGGTTANIISRLLHRPIEEDACQPRSRKIPPAAHMEGFEFVTEGALTLSETLRMLEDNLAPEDLGASAAVRLASLFLNSDILKFAVGTSVNEAHQDPSFPVELDLRRNVVKRLAKVLESKHMKRVIIQYL